MTTIHIGFNAPSLTRCKATKKPPHIPKPATCPRWPALSAAAVTGPRRYKATASGGLWLMPALHAAAGEGAASSTNTRALVPALSAAAVTGVDEAVTSRAAAAPALVAAPAARRTSAAACDTAVEEKVTTEGVLRPALAYATAFRHFKLSSKSNDQIQLAGERHHCMVCISC